MRRTTTGDRRQRATCPVALLPLLLTLASFAGCSSEPPANAYSAEVVENFSAGCRRRATEAVCDCALRRIQQKWTEEQFRALEETLGDDAARQIAETVAACAGR